MGHLFLEKALKAYYVKNVDLNPPFKHSLSLLAKNSRLELCDEQITFLEAVTDFNIEACYPDLKFNFYKKCDHNFAEIVLNKIRVLEKFNVDSIPIIIFVTAYDQYAIKAFDVHAIDYLLKPFDDERF